MRRCRAPLALSDRPGNVIAESDAARCAAYYDGLSAQYEVEVTPGDLSTPSYNCGGSSRICWRDMVRRGCRMPLPSIADIRGADRGYLAFHAPRFQFSLQLIDQHLNEANRRVLDIGLSPFTTLLREYLCTPVDSLGLESRSALQDGTHFQVDLNQLGDRAFQPPRLGPYDLIVFAEVLEHLWTSPLPVLRFLHDALAQEGLLIMQTPNAASLFNA